MLLRSAEGCRGSDTEEPKVRLGSSPDLDGIADGSAMH